MTADKGTFVLALDQGTSGTTASLYGARGEVAASFDVAVGSQFPTAGWVEQDPHELLESIRRAVRELIQQEKLRPGQIACMGLANQGESFLFWDLETGRPVSNVISWRCLRSVGVCQRLMRQGVSSDFQQQTGLRLGPEWPATKVAWAMEKLPRVKELAEAGRLAYSQLDTWFISQLTRERLFVTDSSTAARSGLYNIHERRWDPHLLELFHAGALHLPKVVGSSFYFGEADFGAGWKIPLTGSALDQSAALLGQACLSPGESKVTYGTCLALWYNLGPRLDIDAEDLATSVAWELQGQPTYAVAGEAGTAGSAIVWLRDKLHMEWSDEDLSARAQSAKGQSDIFFIPALGGLGAPHWVPEARGTLYGLTAGTGLEHLVRAGLEAIGFCVRDLVEAVLRHPQLPLSDEIKVDGGMASNDYLLQFQADILGKTLLVPENLEATSTGVAFLAGLACGYYSSLDVLRGSWKMKKRFTPRMTSMERERRYKRWKEVVSHTLALYSPESTEECEALASP